MAGPLSRPRFSDMSRRERYPPWETRGRAGLSLVEVVLGALTLAIVLAAILGAYMGQVSLNEHARNLSFAMNDASRVMERIRSENTGCPSTSWPEVDPERPGSGANNPDDWNEWLDTSGPGAPKSIGLDKTGTNRDDTQERIFVSCLRQGVVGTPPVEADYCDSDQIGAGEWKVSAIAHADFNPIQVTVAVCWRHRGRVVGECRWEANALQPDDRSGTGSVGIIESPVMLTTLITCNG